MSSKLHQMPFTLIRGGAVWWTLAKTKRRARCKTVQLL